MVTVSFNYKEKKYTWKNRTIFKGVYAQENFVRWFSAWLVRYEFDFFRVRLNGRLVARAATYTGV